MQLLYNFTVGESNKFCASVKCRQRIELSRRTIATVSAIVLHNLPLLKESEKLVVVGDSGNLIHKLLPVGTAENEFEKRVGFQSACSIDRKKRCTVHSKGTRSHGLQRKQKRERNSKVNLLFAHSNSYEIKLAVAVSPTISKAPSTAPHCPQHSRIRPPHQPQNNSD